jgi:AcrR family transcriptional regulator
MPDSIAPQALGLPEVPDPVLDGYLDAAAGCFIRHGLRRTRVTDIADAVGVSRVTIYRQLGNTDQIARLLLSRELDRLLGTLGPKVLSASHPDDVVDVIAEAVDYALAHPVLRKVLADESDLVGSYAATELAGLIERLVALAEPLLRRVDHDGSVVDAALLADWLVRVVLTVIVAPPARPVREFISGVLHPLLSPPAHARPAVRRRRANGGRG